MKFPIILYVVLILPTFVISQTQTNQVLMQDASQTLTLSNIWSGKTISIIEGDEIKCWASEQVIKGHLASVQDGILYLLSGVDTLSMSVESISKVRVYGGTLAKTGGAVSALIGGASMAAGTVFAVVGTMGLINSDLSGVVIIFSPLLPIGYGVYKLGMRWYGRSITLGNGWEIKL